MVCSYLIWAVIDVNCKQLIKEKEKEEEKEEEKEGIYCFFFRVILLASMRYFKTLH